MSDVKAPFADESFQYYAGMKKLEKFHAGLAKLKQLRHLKRLDLRYSGVTSTGVQALQAALPDCKVSFVDVTPPASGIHAAAPSGHGDAVLAQWIQFLGGQVQIVEGQVRAVALCSRTVH